MTYSHDDEVRQKIFQDGGGACRHHHPSFSQSEHRKSRQLIRPKASSRTLATGLHVLRPSGATRPRGRSALVVLRQAIELEETFTPYRSEGFPKRREWLNIAMQSHEQKEPQLAVHRGPEDASPSMREGEVFVNQSVMVVQRPGAASLQLGHDSAR